MRKPTKSFSANSKIDVAEYILLRQQIEELRPLKDKTETLKRDLETREDKRRNLLAEREDIKATEYREIYTAARRVSRNQENFRTGFALKSQFRGIVTLSKISCARWAEIFRRLLTACPRKINCLFQNLRGGAGRAKSRLWSITIFRRAPRTELHGLISIFT